MPKVKEGARLNAKTPQETHIKIWYTVIMLLDAGCNLMIFDVTASHPRTWITTIIPSASATFIICHSWPCGGSWSSCHVSVVPHWRWLIADDSSTAWRCHRPDFVKTTGMVAVYQPTRLLSDKFYTSRSQESCLPEPIPAIQTTDNDSERTCTGRAVDAVDPVGSASIDVGSGYVKDLTPDIWHRALAWCTTRRIHRIEM